MARIAIIGGGIAGCTTALRLAKDGHDILILEEKEDLLRGTSARTPGRMGLGYHYFDLSTAKTYMRQTVRFMKEHSECFLGSEESQPYLQNGRYFIVKDSLVDHQDLMATFDKISAEFEGMIRSDSSNDIFQTARLHRSLGRDEYEGDVDRQKVAFAIETKERLLDWGRFSQKLISKIASDDKISVLCKSRVDGVQISEGGNFLVSRTNDDELLEFDYVVNCSWQNIEFLNEKLGIGDAFAKKESPQESTTSRLKLLVEVTLPESLKERPSMFFCVGPHAMFSNLGNGIGRITYAPITNFGTTTASEMPENFRKWLEGRVNKEEVDDYGKRIIEGVAKYIPAMAQAKLLRVIPGIVKSKGSVEITDPNSPFHKRDYSGVTEQQIGWIDNASMKLFYCLGNADEVAKIISTQQIASSNAAEAARNLARSEAARFFPNDESQSKIAERVLQGFYINYLKRYVKSEDLLVRSKRKSPESSDSDEASLAKAAPQSSIENAAFATRSPSKKSASKITSTKTKVETQFMRIADMRNHFFEEFRESPQSSSEKRMDAINEFERALGAVPFSVIVPLDKATYESLDLTQLTPIEKEAAKSSKEAIGMIPLQFATTKDSSKDPSFSEFCEQEKARISEDTTPSIMDDSKDYPSTLDVTRPSAERLFSFKSTEKFRND